MDTANLFIFAELTSSDALVRSRLLGRGYLYSDYSAKIEATVERKDKTLVIHQLRTPVLKRVVDLPYPIEVPIRDLGTGDITRLTLNLETLEGEALCPAYHARGFGGNGLLTVSQLLVTNLMV